MASRDSFLDNIDLPDSQRRAVDRRRRREGFRGGGGSSSPIRRETAEERQERERQERLKEFQSDLSSNTGANVRLTEEETQAILDGRPVSEVREQVVDRQRKTGFTNLQRDLRRSGTRLSEEEAELILSGDADPSQVRERIERRVGSEFTRSSGRSFVTAGSNEIPVSEAVASRVERDVEAGRFEAAQRRLESERVGEFADATGLGGASFESGARVVTPEGESVGGASTTRFASFVGREPTRLVTASGRDVTPRETRRVRGVVSAGPEESSAGRFLEGVGADSGVVSDFASGVGQGLVNPGSSVVELFQVGERGRLDARSTSGAESFGQFVGVGAGGFAVAGLVRAGSFAAGAARSGVTRGLSRLGFTTPSSRAALGGVAGVTAAGGFLAPEVSRSTALVATGRSSVPTELVRFGVNRGVEAAGGFLARGGVRSSFSAGERAAARFGGNRFTSEEVISGFNNLDSVLTPTPSRGFTDSDLVSVRPGSLAARRSFRGGELSSRFLGDGSTLGSIPIPGSGFSQQTLTFGSGSTGVPRAGQVLDSTGSVVGTAFFRENNLPRPFPRVTSAAASNIVSERPGAIGGSRGDLRRVLAGLDDFRFGNLVDDSRLVGSPRVNLPSDQTGLSAFGTISESRVPQSAPVDFSSNVGLFGNRRGQVSVSQFDFPSLGRFRTRPSTRSGARPSRARALRGSQQSDDLLGFAVVPRFGQSAAQQQLPSTLSGSRFGQGFDFDLNEGFGTRSGTLSSQATAQTTGQVTDQLTNTSLAIPSLPTNSPLGGGGTPPARPRTPRRTPRTPRIELPPLNFGLTQRRRRTSGGRREEEFTPSLVANFFNIRGRRPRNSTGIEVRPITLR